MNQDDFAKMTKEWEEKHGIMGAIQIALRGIQNVELQCALCDKKPAGGVVIMDIPDDVCEKARADVKKAGFKPPPEDVSPVLIIPMCPECAATPDHELRAVRKLRDLASRELLNDLASKLSVVN